MTVTKHLESLSSSKPSIDVASKGENSALVQFSLQGRSESHPVATEAPIGTEQNEVPPIKLLLERMGGICMAADKNNTKGEGQANVAWTRLFQPEGFKEKTETVAICLSLEENIYG